MLCPMRSTKGVRYPKAACSPYRRLVADPVALKWFAGLFRRAHIAVGDTREAFTVLHHGDQAEVAEGFVGEPERRPPRSIALRATPH